MTFLLTSAFLAVGVTSLAGQDSSPEINLAKGVLISTAGISARDAVHAAVMVNRHVEWIPTFDRGFDRIGSIRRLKLV